MEPETFQFSAGEAIRFGWNRTKENLGFLSAFLALGFLILVAMNLVVELANKNAPPITNLIFRVVSVVLQSAVSMGFIRAALRLCDDEKGEFSDLFSSLPLFFKYFLGSIIYILIVLAGMVLLIFPGIVWSIKYVFFSYFIVDKGQGPFEALGNSSRLTRGVKGDLFLLGLLLAAMNIVGFVALMVGLFLTVPVSMLAFAFAYRLLESRANAAVGNNTS